MTDAPTAISIPSGIAEAWPANLRMLAAVIAELAARPSPAIGAEWMGCL